MAIKKHVAAKSAKNAKKSASGAKAPAKKAVATKNVKKAAAPAKKAVIKKTVPAKKVAAPAKKAVVKKAVPAKKATPAKKVVVKKAAPAAKPNNKKTVTKNNLKQVKKTTGKAVAAPKKAASPKKAAPAKKAATPANKKKEVVAKKATPAPAKKVVAPAKKAAPAAPAKKSAPAPAPAPKATAPKKTVEVPAKPAPRKATPASKKGPTQFVTTNLSRPSAKTTTTTGRPTPTATPSAREAKKTNVIIAHRRVENKSKQNDDSKTMINYQPEFHRSILDEPAQQQGPVYRYSDEELGEFKEIIVSRLDAARRELVYLQGLITRKDEAGTEDTENRYMNMEDGSGAMEREQLAQLASRQIQFINHLEKAMVRIENKTYGICRVTGKLIEKARLRAVPHATLSIEAKKYMSNKQ